MSRKPLRKVVGFGINIFGNATEALECGHVLLRKSDGRGPTTAARRRCWKCEKGMPPTQEARRDA